MFWETYKLGTSYDRVRHKDCGREMNMPQSHYPHLAFWACECGWFGTFEYMSKKDAQWYADHFEGYLSVRDGGRMVWVIADDGTRHTRVMPKLWLNRDGTIAGGGTWEPYV